MPIYEYACRDCGHEFEKIVQSSSKPTCPACNSPSLEQQFSVFAVRAGGDSLAIQGPTACRSCGDARGPGSCRAN